MRAGLRSFAIGVFLLFLATPAAAEKRVALVIGNNAYPSLTAEEQLKRAINDAHRVGDALEAIGFEVARGENLSRGELLTSLFTTANMLGEGDVAFFFYAGHGVSIDGANYLIPSDIPPAGSGAEDLVKASAIPESMVVETLKARGVRVAVVVLDACRNNPFTQGGTRAFGDATRGLTRPPSVQPQGVFGLYSAGFGEQALDGLGDDDASPNSVFTRVLAPALVEPGQSLLDIAYHVNEEVARLAKSVGHDQNPAYYDQARARDVFLVAAAAAESEVATAAPEAVSPNTDGPSAAVDPCGAASVHFEAARSIGRIEALEDHLAKFPSCQFADLARLLIDGLRADAAGAVEQEVAALPDPAAEAEAASTGEVSVLGMSLVTLPEAEREHYNIPSDATGAVVRAVESGSDAESHGIVPGDVILELFGEPVRSAADLVSRMEVRRSAGNLSMLLLVRNAIESRFVGLTFPEQEQGAAAALVEPQAALTEEQATDLPALQGPDGSAPPNGLTLGVQIQNVTLELAEALGMTDAAGVVVTSVKPDMPASLAKIETGDVLLEFGGKPINDMRHLVDLMATVSPYDTVEVTVLRDGQRLPLDVLFFPEEAATATAPPEPPTDTPDNSADASTITTTGFDTAGIRSISVTLEVAEAFGMTDTTGAIVAEITEGSPADSAGIEIGDLMLEFDGQAIQTPAHLVELFAATAPGQTVEVVLMHQGDRITRKVELAEAAADETAVELNTLEEDSNRASAECSRLSASNPTTAGELQAAERACREARYNALRVAAEYGDAESQYLVGTMTEEGSGVAPSDIEAVKWYQLAVAQDYGDAHWRLGLMYQSGRGGLSESVPQAVHHLMRALWRKSEAARAELIDGRGASLTPAIREAIQDNLKGLGYYSGNVDGTFDQATIAALEKFSAS